MHRSPVSLRRSWIVAAVLAVLAALLAPTTASAAEGGPKLTVMTRNLYLGSGLTNLFAGDLTTFLAAVGTDWAHVIANDFPTRAGALADEIVGAKADVVSLQEVSLWRDEDPYLGVPATHVVYDYLALLQGALAARGMPYVAVATSENVDAQAPWIDPAPTPHFAAVRMTDHDVILVRAPLAGKFSNPQSGHYAAQYGELSTATGQEISFTRGWASIDYHPDAKTAVRIFDTHLETEDHPDVQEAQAQEFLDLVTGSPVPVIALGDFNSAADGSTTKTYAMLTAALTDAWMTARPGDPGLSCCQSEMLSNQQSAAYERIDLVLTNEKWPADRVALTGSSPFRSSPAPLWASDHFGVTARLELQR